MTDLFDILAFSHNLKLELFASNKSPPLFFTPNGRGLFFREEKDHFLLPESLDSHPSKNHRATQVIFFFLVTLC